VPGLLSYVRTNRRDGLPPALPYLTTLYHRWAAPWGCFTIIFIAAPLGIVYSRRGILGGVASAIFLFGAIIFLTELFLSLSKGGYLPALAAAWLANGIFLVLGGIFLYLRARNRSVRLPRLRALRV
jgi:lipopolysaccharide export LptBFGC system permease protein LptF